MAHATAGEGAQTGAGAESLAPLILTTGGPTLHMPAVCGRSCSSMSSPVTWSGNVRSANMSYHVISVMARHFPRLAQCVQHFLLSLLARSSRS